MDKLKNVALLSYANNKLHHHIPFLNGKMNKQGYQIILYHYDEINKVFDKNIDLLLLDTNQYKFTIDDVLNLPKFKDDKKTRNRLNLIIELHKPMQELLKKDLESQDYLVTLMNFSNMPSKRLVIIDGYSNPAYAPTREEIFAQVIGWDYCNVVNTSDEEFYDKIEKAILR